MKIEEFLSPKEEQEIVRAIEAAEKQTSGEIRLHLELHCPDTALNRAVEVFNMLEMENTKERNGVLIYIAVDDHKMAILGDKGIDQAVGKRFWEDEIELMTVYFKNGKFREGLIAAIAEVGKKLRAHFPYENKGSLNELDNEISYG